MTDSSPSSEAVSLAQKLDDTIQDFLSSQRTLLRLVDFIALRQSEIDSRRDSIAHFARIEFPDCPDEIIDSILAGMDGISQIAAHYESDESTPDVTEQVRLAVGAMIDKLPDDYKSHTFLSAIVRGQAQEPSGPLLLSSLLITLVGDFELLVGALARALLAEHPSAMDGSDRQFTWKDISAHVTFEDFKEQVVDRAVDDLLRDSNVGWMKFFEGKFKVVVPSTAGAADFLEVFQRRNVVVHAGGKVSRQYLTQLKLSEPALGTKLVVDEEYIRNAADLLCVVALGLVQNIAGKVLKGDQLAQLESSYENAPYRLLQDGRFLAAKLFLDEPSVVPLKSEYSRLVFQINAWLARKRLGEFETCRKEVEEWDVMPLAPIFHLAKYALLDEFEKGHPLVLSLRGSPTLSVGFWLSWPLLAELREYEKNLPKTQNTVVVDESLDDVPAV